jgi:hypothetical protein
MFRKFAITLIALSALAGRAAAQDFEWTEVANKGKKVINARVAPAVYERLLKDGLEVTEGTTGTNPMIKVGKPGAKKLKLGGKMFRFAGSSGFAEVDGKKIYLLKFVPAIELADLVGKWSGGDWGTVEIQKNGSDTYTDTYDKQLAGFNLKEGADGVFVGDWREKTATKGHPTRMGRFTEIAVSKDERKAEVVWTATVKWESADGDKTRGQRGTSTWTRTEKKK